MTTIFDATTPKQLGIDNATASKIVKLRKGSKTEAPLGARTISGIVGASRRRVMRLLEMKGLADYSVGSYA